MSKRPDIWMPIYIGDYLADTGHLSTTQHGAYLLLLMHYWRKRELPEDDKQLAAIAKLPLRIWLDSKDTIQAFFFDGWKHKRIEAELQRRAEVSSKRAEAGAKGGSRGRAEQELSNCSSFASSLLKQNGSMTQSQSDIDVAGDARKPPSPSFELAEKLLVIAGHDAKFWPPGWCGAPHRVATWLSQGWQPEIIIAAVTAAAARKRGEPANSVQFFEKAIAEEHARQAAPLPRVEIGEQQTVKVRHGRNGKSGDIIAASDKLVSIIDSFSAGPGEADQLRGPEGAADVRLLPQG
jgi:uncharacterized protein YdaU (DUF1376 family)